MVKQQDWEKKKKTELKIQFQFLIQKERKKDWKV